MKKLFGASTNFYSGSSFGKAVEGAPATVRSFEVKSVTARSFVVEYGLKVNKKTMKLNFGNFLVDMFETCELATQSLILKKSPTR